MNQVELIFIPSPEMSHLVATIEAAKLLLARNGRLAITILIMKLPNNKNASNDYKKKILSITKDTLRLRLIDIPDEDDNSNQSNTFFLDYINNLKIDNIKQIVSNLIKEPSIPDCRQAGLVLDMFCMKFMEVAKEFDIPSYVFFTSGACSLGIFYDVISLRYEHNQDLRQYKDSETEISVQCVSQPFPVKLLPYVYLNGSPIGERLLEDFKKFKETNGIVINTFHELESYAIEALLTRYDSPKVYPVGPILEANRDQLGNDLKDWLDKQPENSVVFLCFGTMGAFDEKQVKEFAKALEDSGSSFLWSLRKPEKKGEMHIPAEYDTFDEVLPEGFLERTKGVGRVIGWAPQVAVLAHAAVGGFVSHCGWNSTLESVLHGVPVATFPLYAEQPMNAFQLVRESGIAEEIRIDHRLDTRGETEVELVPAKDIEAAIRRLMALESGVRGKVKEMQRKSRAALEEGGSSYKSQIEFVEDVIRNVGLK